MAVRYKR
jgi:hypothetical protein